MDGISRVVTIEESNVVGNGPLVMVVEAVLVAEDLGCSAELVDPFPDTAMLDVTEETPL